MLVLCDIFDIVPAAVAACRGKLPPGRLLTAAYIVCGDAARGPIGYLVPSGPGESANGEWSNRRLARQWPPLVGATAVTGGYARPLKWGLSGTLASSSGGVRHPRVRIACFLLCARQHWLSA